MSCGSPHDMDCGRVLDQVFVYLDGEIDDEDCVQIRSHLEECAPCLRKYGLEQEFKAFLARRCGCQEAPRDLRGRLLGKLSEVRLEIAQVEYRVD